MLPPLLSVPTVGKRHSWADLIDFFHLFIDKRLNFWGLHIDSSAIYKIMYKTPPYIAYSGVPIKITFRTDSLSYMADLPADCN